MFSESSDFSFLRQKKSNKNQALYDIGMKFRFSSLNKFILAVD